MGFTQSYFTVGKKYEGFERGKDYFFNLIIFITFVLHLKLIIMTLESKRKKLERILQ